MQNNIIIGIVIIVCTILGFIFGIFTVKILLKIQDRKIKKNAEEVIEGKRDNFIEVDGEKIPANKFRLRNDDGTEKIINLKGGTEEDVTKTKNKKTTKETISKDNSYSREDSSSIRKKKRDTRRRTSRIRRYG